MDKAELEELREAIKHAGPNSAYAGRFRIFSRLLDHIDALEQKREGWKWVPVEPTIEMVVARIDYDKRQYRNYKEITIEGEYKAMIAAAPEPQEAASSINNSPSP